MQTKKGIAHAKAIDLNHSLSRKAYKKELLRAQLQLRQLAYQLYLSKRSMVMFSRGRMAWGKAVLSSGWYSNSIRAATRPPIGPPERMNAPITPAALLALLDPSRQEANPDLQSQLVWTGVG